MLRDLSPEVTDYTLKNQFFGRIGCAVDGKVLVVPVTYLYDGQAIYGQTREGTKTSILRRNPMVCFEVDEVFSPAHWRSVVVQGVYEELTGDDRRCIEQRLGPARVASCLAPATGTDGALLQDTVVYRIRILTKTGRAEINDDSSSFRDIACQPRQIALL